MRAPALALVVVLAGCAPAEEPCMGQPLAIWMWGQSNQVGGASTDDLSAGNVGYKDAYPSVQLAQTLCSQAVGPTIDVYPFEALQPHRVIGSNPASARKSFGAELSMGRRLREFYGDGAIYLIKWARNGTSLNVHWKPTAAPPAGESENLYTQAFNFCRQKTLEIGATVLALDWCQGNGDANGAGPAGLYAENMTALSDRWLADLGYFAWLIFDQLPSGVVAPHVATVRAEQAYFASTTPGVIMIPTEGLALRDDDHYEANAFIDLGTLKGNALCFGDVAAELAAADELAADMVATDELGVELAADDLVGELADVDAVAADLAEDLLQAGLEEPDILVCSLEEV